MKKTLLAGILLASTAAYAAPPAHADDHVIRPQCWDENVNGEVHHHCEVQRPQSAQVPGRTAQEPLPRSPNPPVAAPPPYYGPPQYVGPPPTGYYPGYYGRPYIPGPLAVFRFGPFRFVIP
jgi:hypothetical protein